MYHRLKRSSFGFLALNPVAFELEFSSKIFEKKGVKLDQIIVPKLQGLKMKPFMLRCTRVIFGDFFSPWANFICRGLRNMSQGVFWGKIPNCLRRVP